MRYILILPLILALCSCKKEPINNKPDEETPPITINNSYIFLCNEGPFQSGTGTISRIDKSSKSLSNNLFENANGVSLGNIVQSIAIFKNKAYIAVNNSGKIEMVDISTFKSVGNITGLSYPRFILFLSNTKAYISEWSGKIKILNPSTNQIIGQIAAEKYPDKMMLIKDKVFVINSAGFDKDSTISIIDTASNTIVNKIVVGLNPAGIKLDRNEQVWVLCKGSSYKDNSKAINGKLLRINPTTFSIDKIYNLSGSYFDAKLAINGKKDKLFYSFTDGVYEFPITANSLNTTPYIKGRQFYNIDIDPYNDNLCATDALDFQQSGKFIRYNIESCCPIKLDSFSVGIIPSEMTFFQN